MKTHPIEKLAIVTVSSRAVSTREMVLSQRGDSMPRRAFRVMPSFPVSR